MPLVPRAPEQESAAHLLVAGEEDGEHALVEHPTFGVAACDPDHRLIGAPPPALAPRAEALVLGDQPRTGEDPEVVARRAARLAEPPSDP